MGLFLALGMGRDHRAHPPRALRRGTGASRTRGQPDHGDHRQPDGEGGAKGGSTLNPSGYDAGKKVIGRSRPASAHATADAALLRRIRTIHAASHGTYDTPRVHAELQAEATAVARKRVARLMRGAGLRGVSRRRFPMTTQREASHRPAHDLVGRDFRAAGPNRLWVADITYVPTAAGFLFLAVVLDAWSRRIVGWAMATDLRTRLVLDALDMAVTTRKPADVVHHSDQGSQLGFNWSSQRDPDLLGGLRREPRRASAPSTGSVGDAYDNAMAEAFFATLECELLDRRSFRSQAEARMAVFAFIEGFYNPTRRHSALGYLAPIEHETRAMAKND
jgi:putative transposase